MVRFEIVRAMDLLQLILCSEHSMVCVQPDSMNGDSIGWRNRCLLYFLHGFFFFFVVYCAVCAYTSIRAHWVYLCVSVGRSFGVHHNIVFWCSRSAELMPNCIALQHLHIMSPNNNNNSIVFVGKKKSTQSECVHKQNACILREVRASNNTCNNIQLLR